MKRPDGELAALVAEWLRKADLDYDAMRYLLSEGRLREVAVFHAQQAVEKFLKALLTERQIEFPKVHDLRKLLALVRTVDPELADSLVEIEWLDPFAVEVRYPADAPEVLPGDELKARDLAERVRTAIRRSPLP